MHRLGNFTYTELGLRIAALVSGVVGTCLIARAVDLQQYFYTDGTGSFVDGMVLMATVYSNLWSAIALGLRLGQVLYHPGVDIALDFIASGLSFSFAAVLLTWVLEWPNGYSDYQCYTRTGNECSDGVGTFLTGLERAGVAMVFFNGLAHFIIFVWACRATHVRRMQKKAGRDSYVELETGKAVPKT